MTVKSNRINTSVSFAFANIAENSLEVKQGDLLSFTADGFVTKATPETVIIGIANDKFSFPETNETQEQWRVNYNPVIWENTYKMEVKEVDMRGPNHDYTWSLLKVGYFYTMDENQKVDPTTASPSVGQFMIQDIYENCVDVRFVTNVGLAIDQYEDVRLESIAPKNPESTPFDGIYNFTLSNGTVIEGDFSDLCRWTTDIEFGGNVTIDGNLQVVGESTLGDTTTNNLTANDIQANSVTADVTAETANIGEANITDLNVENMNYENSVHFEHDVDIDEDLNVDGNVHVGNCATVDHILTVNEQLLLGPNATAPQFILQSEKNQPNGVAGLDSNGLLSNSVLPPLAIGETYICADEAEQLALTAQRGDFCVRTDLNKTFIKLNDTNPATMADWQEIVAELPETGYREEYTETGSLSYTLEHTPVSPTSFMVYTDSGTILFPTVDYTYDNTTRTITFLSLNNNETVHIWNLSYGTQTPPTPPTPPTPTDRANRGPASEGFHVPTKAERDNLISLGSTLGIGVNGQGIGELLLPFTGRLDMDPDTYAQGGHGDYRCCDNYYCYLDSHISNFGTNSKTNLAGAGLSIRAFKDTPVTPDGTWTVLFDASGMAPGAGVFQDGGNGLISISTDGQTWVTIQDKNLGAQSAWHPGDALSESNCGTYYQRGNNYSFPFNGQGVSTSTTQVDTTGYGPGNYYNNSTFITPYTQDWSNPANDDLWGGISIQS